MSTPTRLLSKAQIERLEHYMTIVPAEQYQLVALARWAAKAHALLLQFAKYDDDEAPADPDISLADLMDEVRTLLAEIAAPEEPGAKVPRKGYSCCPR